MYINPLGLIKLYLIAETFRKRKRKTERNFPHFPFERTFCSYNW